LIARILLVSLVVSSNVTVAQDGPTIKPDVVYGHKHGLAMTYDVITPKNSNGAGLIFMVSGGWVSRWAPPEQLAQTLLKPLIEKGYTVIALRHGSSPKYVIPEIALDIRQAIEHIAAHCEAYAIDPDRLGVFGFSAGGHLSLLLGTQTNHREDGIKIGAVVAVFPPTDLAPYVQKDNPLRERFPSLKFEPSEAEKYSPLHHVTADDAPTLLVHGDKDELVPIWHSHKIRDEFLKVSVTNKLITMEGAAHGFDSDRMQQTYAAMIEWFDQHLPKKL
jgi:acetyl esterase/lipase